MVGIIFIFLTTSELRRQKTNLFIEEAAAMEFEFIETYDNISSVYIDDDKDYEDDNNDDDFITMRIY